MARIRTLSFDRIPEHLREDYLQDQSNFDREAVPDPVWAWAFLRRNPEFIKLSKKIKKRISTENLDRLWPRCPEFEEYKKFGPETYIDHELSLKGNRGRALRPVNLPDYIPTEEIFTVINDLVSLEAQGGAGDLEQYWPYNGQFLYVPYSVFEEDARCQFEILMKHMNLPKKSERPKPSLQRSRANFTQYLKAYDLYTHVLDRRRGYAAIGHTMSPNDNAHEEYKIGKKLYESAKFLIEKNGYKHLAADRAPLVSIPAVELCSDDELESLKKETIAWCEENSADADFFTKYIIKEQHRRINYNAKLKKRDLKKRNWEESGQEAIDYCVVKATVWRQEIIGDAEVKTPDPASLKRYKKSKAKKKSNKNK